MNPNANLHNTNTNVQIVNQQDEELDDKVDGRQGLDVMANTEQMTENELADFNVQIRGSTRMSDSLSQKSGF